MKAKITPGNSTSILTLIPESEEEAADIKVLSGALTRSHQINARGFKYMEPDVEFYIQPMSRGD